MRIIMAAILLMLATQAISGEEGQRRVYDAKQPTERVNIFVDGEYYRHLSLVAVCSEAQREDTWSDANPLPVRSVQDKSAAFVTNCVW